MPKPMSDPRLAALQHAAACEVGCHEDNEHAVAREAVHAIVSGLLYVGDQLAGLRPDGIPHDEAVQRARDALTDAISCGELRAEVLAKVAVAAMFPLSEIKIGGSDGSAGD